MNKVIEQYIPPPTPKEARDTIRSDGPLFRTNHVQSVLVKLRPARILPVWTRYVITAAIVFLSFGTRIFLEGIYPYPYFLFMPAIIFASALFDRGTGIFATLLSAALAFYFFVEPIYSFEVANFGEFFGLCVFIMSGILTAVIIEALRVSVDELGEYSEQLESSDKNLRWYAEELEESHKNLDDFAYIVAHDLKAPVRAINNFSSFLMEDCKGKLDPQNMEHLHTLQTSAKRMDELISDLLQYALLSRQDGKSEKTDLHQVINNILELMSFQLDENNASVKVPGNLPHVLCNAAHIGEIFRNLIENGIKYNDSERKEIEIGFIENHPRNPGGFVFFVKDNGIGIPEEHQEAIFKMFKRLHGQNEYGGGTGSGLAIVKKLIDKNDGEIWVQSQKGKGSIFYFYLSCTRAPLGRS